MNHVRAMRLACFGTPDEIKPLLEPYLNGFQYTLYPEPLFSENTDKAKGFEIISVFVDSVVNKEIIDALPDLKCIATQSTGFDHIDVKYAKEKGIVVMSVPEYGSRSVAEHTFALMLTMSRRVFEAYHQVREEGSFDIGHLQGFDLFGKTLGVVGAGRIGKNVIRIARGFDMNVLANDRYPDQKFAAELGFEFVELGNLLAKSDIITLHVPATDDTNHLINKESISKMKKGAYIVNTSRGAVIDTEALVSALQSGQLGGAALDVLEGEHTLKEEAELVAGKLLINELKTLIQNHELIDMKNVIITPHIASHSIESDMARLKTTAENIKSFLDGKPQNVVEL